MDDLTSMLSGILNDPQSMQQIQAVASQLGLTGDGTGGPPAPAPAAPPPDTAPAQETGGFDLSALSSLLGSSGQQQADPGTASPSAGIDMNALSSALSSLTANAPAPAQSGGGADLSSLLSGLSGNATAPASGGGGIDLSALSGLMGGLAGSQPANNSVSALTSLLGGGQQSGGVGGGLPFDMGTLLKLQQAMSNLSANRGNVELLMALKPRLKGHRAKKVDDAVRVMQLIQFLPLIKETGLFGDLGADGLNLGSLGGSLGGLVGGIGDGIGSVLGNLFRR